MSVVVLNREGHVHDVTIDELPVLVPERDLRGWDEGAVDLVMEYQNYGWTPRLSSNNHAILRSPDGKATASVARKHSRNRGGKNARRPLENWLRRRERERQKRESAFGNLNADHDVREPPWRTADRQSYDARMRMRKILGSWWDSIDNSGDSLTASELIERGEDDWIVVELTMPDNKMSIVGQGRDTDPELVEDVQGRIERFNNPKGTRQMQETGPLSDKKYPCLEPGCGKGYDTRGALNLHSQKHVEGGKIPCPMCEDGRTLPTPAAFGKHVRSRLHADDPRLPAILESKGLAPLVVKVKPEPKVKRTSATVRMCEYGCGQELSGYQVGGHHRAHQRAGHVKVADGGDGATQVMRTAKAITAPVKASEAVTEAPVKPEPLVVEAVPVEPVPVATNGKHDASPEDTLAKVQAIVNPGLIAENRRLNRENARLEAEVEILTTKCNDLQAFKDMIREATSA